MFITGSFIKKQRIQVILKTQEFCHCTIKNTHTYLSTMSSLHSRILGTKCPQHPTLTAYTSSLIKPPVMNFLSHFVTLTWPHPVAPKPTNQPVMSKAPKIQLGHKVFVCMHRHMCVCTCVSPFPLCRGQEVKGCSNRVLCKQHIIKGDKKKGDKTLLLASCACLTAPTKKIE